MNAGEEDLPSLLDFEALMPKMKTTGKWCMWISSQLSVNLKRESEGKPPIEFDENDIDEVIYYESE